MRDVVDVVDISDSKGLDKSEDIRGSMITTNEFMDKSRATDSR